MAKGGEIIILTNTCTFLTVIIINTLLLVILVYMKVLPFKIPALADSSIRVDREQLKAFYPHLHTHQELQLTWIVRGAGTAFIGDKIRRFVSGEIFLMSSNLPHVFKSEDSFDTVESLSIYFDPGFIGSSFLNLPESEHLNSFLSTFKTGAYFTPGKDELLKSQLLIIEKESGLKRILLFIEMMEFIATHSIYETIASTEYASPKMKDGEKIDGIIGHLYSNYAKDINLNEVAELAHMTPQAFCRYFKRHTRKSMVKYLNEIRIGKVCGWLQDKKYTVTESCYQAGFNNISHFNRTFKSITGYTPSGYIMKHQTL